MTHDGNIGEKAGEYSDNSSDKASGDRLFSFFDMLDAEQNSRDDSQVVKSILESAIILLYISIF
jgi:hypothetical protein